MHSAIQTKDLTKYYGSHLGISDLCLDVDVGEVFGFLGPNGAGKTTTIRVLMGMISATGGEALVLGHDARANRRDVLLETGYLPGDFGLYNDLTGNEYLSHLLRLRGNDAVRAFGDNLASLKARFDISYDRRVSGYSKGMRQVLGIIQAFMHDPPLVILEEPTSGLDPVMQERFCELITEKRNGGKTVFLSSHILSEVERLCDRVGFVKEGRLVAVENLGDRRSIVGKKVTVSLRGDSHSAMGSLERLPGVRGAGVNANCLAFFYDGPIARLIEWASALEIDDLDCETPSVEDVFLRLYGD
jgi:ABC-2 type transport system ATP-binding protein